MTIFGEKLSSGLKTGLDEFKLPVSKLPFTGELGWCFSDHGFIYSTAYNKGVAVFQENTLEEVASDISVDNIILSTQLGILFLNKQGKLSEYIKSIGITIYSSLDAPYTGEGTGSNQGDYFLIMGSGKPEDNSLRARINAKRHIYKYSSNPYELKWKVTPPTNEFSYLVINERSNQFYGISYDLFIHCYSLETGELLWSNDFSNEVKDPSKTFSVKPSLSGNTIVIICMGETFGFSAGSGELIWKRVAATGDRGIITNEGVVYQIEHSFKEDKDYLIALEGETGKLIAKHLIDIDDNPEFLERVAFMNPMHWVMSKTHIIIGWSDGFITAINPNNGHIDWLEDVGNGKKDAVVPGMLLSNNRLYCRTIRSDIEDRVSSSWVFEGEGGFIVD